MGASLFARVFGVCWLAGSMSLSAQQESLPIPDLTEKPKLREAKDYKEIQQELLVPEFVPARGVSKSVTNLFLVTGGKASLRSEIASLGDQVTEELRQLLKEELPDGKKTPISIVLHDPRGKKIEGSPYRKQFGSSADGGFYLSLNILKSSGLEKLRLKRALLEMLLLRRTLEAKLAIAQDDVLVNHPWVVDGLMEVMDWRAKKLSRKTFKELSDKPGLYDLQQMLDYKRSEIDGFDAVTKRSYSAAAGALILALGQHKDGREAMKAFLGELALYQGEMNGLLRRHFPEVNKGKNGLRVALLLQLEVMAMTPLSESLTILETEKRLDDILVFRYLDEVGAQQEVAIEDFKDILELEEKQRRIAINVVAKKVVDLNNRCFPDYRPILFAYGTVLNALSQGNDEEVANMIRNLATDRKFGKLGRLRAQRARDYLDWYMINYTSGVTGDYSVFAQIEKEVEERVKVRSDRQLGSYLDKLEAYLER